MLVEAFGEQRGVESEKSKVELLWHEPLTDAYWR